MQEQRQGRDHCQLNLSQALAVAAGSAWHRALLPPLSSPLFLAAWEVGLDDGGRILQALPRAAAVQDPGAQDRAGILGVPSTTNQTRDEGCTTDTASPQQLVNHASLLLSYLGWTPTLQPYLKQSPGTTMLLSGGKHASFCCLQASNSCLADDRTAAASICLTTNEGWHSHSAVLGNPR